MRDEECKVVPKGVISFFFFYFFSFFLFLLLCNWVRICFILYKSVPNMGGELNPMTLVTVQPETTSFAGFGQIFLKTGSQFISRRASSQRLGKQITAVAENKHRVNDSFDHIARFWQLSVPSCFPAACNRENSLSSLFNPPIPFAVLSFSHSCLPSRSHNHS